MIISNSQSKIIRRAKKQESVTHKKKNLWLEIDPEIATWLDEHSSTLTLRHKGVPRWLSPLSVQLVVSQVMIS